jgi:hypothetical protein
VPTRTSQAWYRVVPAAGVQGNIDAAQGRGQHLLVIGERVRPSVAGAEQHGQALAGIPAPALGQAGDPDRTDRGVTGPSA